MNGAGIPEWVMWLGAGIGAMLSALVMRLGWKSAGGEKMSPSKSFTLDAALVDSSSIIKLASAIEGQTMERIAARQEAEKARKIAYDGLEVMRDIEKELQELRNEIRRLGDTLIARRA